MSVLVGLFLMKLGLFLCKIELFHTLKTSQSLFQNVVCDFYIRILKKKLQIDPYKKKKSSGWTTLTIWFQSKLAKTCLGIYLTASKI